MVKKATTVKERNEQQQKDAHPISSRLKTKAPTSTKANENTNMMRTPYVLFIYLINYNFFSTRSMTNRARIVNEFMIGNADICFVCDMNMCTFDSDVARMKHVNE
jgi:hypothetical protein